MAIHQMYSIWLEDVSANVWFIHTSPRTMCRWGQDQNEHWMKRREKERFRNEGSEPQQTAPGYRKEISDGGEERRKVAGDVGQKGGGGGRRLQQMGTERE